MHPHPLDTTLGPLAPFVTTLLTELATLTMELTCPHIDHLCYRATSLTHYASLREILQRHGSLLVEGMIGGRPIATYHLNQAVISGQHQVSYLELAAPKAGRSHPSGLEHIEIVVPSLTELIARYPQLPFNRNKLNSLRNPDISVQLPSGAIKFHLAPLAHLIAQEIAHNEVIPLPADLFNNTGL